MRRLALTLLGVVTIAACRSGGDGLPVTSPRGEPTIDAAVVEQHASQFASDVPRRAAGSSEELAAATYLLGHLQQAGYVARLDGVPVADLVRSTNVIALPPSGTDPEVLVAIAYDTGESEADPEALGLFLELARALRVARPEHSVEFAAVGADQTTAGGGLLGTRRLVKTLLDQRAQPLVVRLDLAGAGTPGAAGTSTLGLPRIEDRLPRSAQVLQRARLSFSYVTGDVRELGPLLLDYLS